MKCKRIAYTGKAESILFDTIYDKIANQNEKVAEELFAYFGKESFIEDFGDYLQDYKNNKYDSNRIDENGEPALFYDDTAKKHYYLNKNNEKVYFPLVDRGLRAIYSYKQIAKIKSRLALNYFKNSGLDFNNIEFSEGESLPNLRNFIIKEITDKATELKEQGGVSLLKARSLERSLKYVDELVENVENFFRELSIEIIENEEDTSFLEEEGRDPSFNQHSAERNTKDNISANVKLRLSLLEDPNTLDPIWNEPTFLDRDMVYSTLQSVLSNEIALPSEDLFENYKTYLSRVQDKKPYLKGLLEYLNKVTSENQKSEFVQAFNLIKNNHIVTQFEITKRVVNEETGETEMFVEHRSLPISDTGSKITVVKDAWDINFQNNFLTADNTLKTGSIERLNKASNVLKQYFKDSELLTEDNVEGFEILANKSIKFLETLGVNLTKEGFDNFIDNFGKDITFNDRLKNLKTLINQTEYVVNGIKTKYSYKSEDYSSFIGLSQTLTKLASSEAFFLNEGSDATIVTSSSTGKSKQKWIYSYPSYVSTKVKQWKKNPKLLLDLYKSGNYQLGSFYMGVLTGTINNKGEKLNLEEKDQLELSKKILEGLDVAIMNQMSSDSEYKETTNLSYKDYLVDYVNKVLKEDDFIRTTTPADKTTELQIKTGIRLNSFNGLNQDKKINIRPRTLDIFFNYFSSEYNRMLEANQDVINAETNPEKYKLTPHYHYQYEIKDKNGNKIINPNPYDKSGNAFKSQYFEKLSPNSKGQTNLEDQITNLLYDNKGNFNFQKLTRESSEELNSLFNQYITTNLRSRIEQTISYLQANEVFIRNKEGIIVPNKIDSKILTSGAYRNVSAAQKAIAFATDFIINGLVSNVEYSKMFTGDVAFYKNMVDYKKRVPASYTDGLQLRITQGNEFFNIATIESVYRKSPFYDLLVESLSEEGARPYENINSADAQAWITPKRWKFLIQALGKWTKVHDEVYKKMISNNIEQYTEKELKVAAQPLKGVYFFRDNSGKPTYLKYSQAVLTKSLIQDSDLEKVFNQMEVDNVDELITFDGVKVGAIEPTKIHDENGNVVQDIKYNVQTLSNYGWKLQQDLPTKTYKDTDVGSQIQKNIFAGLLHLQNDTNFELDGQLVSGKYVKDEIVKTITGLTNQGLESLKKEFKIDDDFRIGDISGFYNALISELQKRGGSENVIKALQSEVTIVGIPQSSEKLFNMFASIMNSRLVKIKTNGGSFIQMSNFGLNKSEADSKGVIWHPEALSTVHEPHIYIHPETLRPTVRPGGVLISGSFIAKYIPNWKSYDEVELFVGKDGKPPIIDKKIQDNIIGYRIPNQGLASNDALQIVGILPETSGDTIVAYTGITTKTGSDFDVDKMYIMFPSYNKKDKQLIYKENDLGNRLIELYKSVLTHPEVYKSVMKPIDIEFIKNEINTLFPETDSVFMSHFDPEVDLKLRYYFLGGKAGVGQEANALVDISREGKLSLNDIKYITWGHHNTEGESAFDFEYSEELSDKDLDYYVKQIVKSTATQKEIDEFKNELRKVKVGDSLTAILNAFVDIAKDPYISKGNWTTATTNIGNLLLRIGAHPLYVVNFLANPVIAEYIEYLKSKEGITNTEKDLGSLDSFKKFKKHIVKTALNASTPESSNTLLGNLYLDYYKNFNIDWQKEKLSQDLKNNFVTKEQYDKEIIKLDNSFNTSKTKVKKLLKVSDEEITNIINLMNQQHSKVFLHEKYSVFNKDRFDLEYFRNQVTTTKPDSEFRMNILNTFKELNEFSKNVRENVMVSKLDTDGMGKDHNKLFTIFNMIQIINDKVENNVPGAIKGFNSKFEGTTLEAYYNSLKWVKNVVESNPLLFPTGTIQTRQQFNEISQDVYSSLLTNEEMSNDLSREYNSYLMEQFFNITKEEKLDLIDNLPNRFKEFKEANKDKYFILDELTLDIPKSKKRKAIISLTNRKKSKAYEKIFTDSWRDLFIDNPTLAEDLVKYSFVTSGFKMNATQFYTYIPFEYFVQNQINSKVNDIINNNTFDFLDKFYLNKLENKKYVKKVFDNNLNLAIGTNVVKKDNGFKLEKGSKYYVELEVKIPDNAPADFVPKLKYYKLVGFNKNEDGLYVRINNTPLSLNKRKLTDYSDNIFDDVINEETQYIKSQVIFDRNMNKINDIVDDVIETTEVQPQVQPQSNKILFKEELTLGYKNRTIKNASADATIAIAIDFNSAGERLTKSSVLSQNKKYISLDASNLTVTQERVDKIVEQLNSAKEYTSENITSLKPNEVFVFGSNAEGVHGKGAALLAKTNFGAKQSQSEGLQGQSYAVITKKNWRVEKSSTLEEIGKGLQDMLLFAKQNPDKKFLVTKLGSSLAGYSVEEIKELFEKLKNIIPNNVILPKEYEIRGITLNIAGNGIYTMKGKYTQQQVDDFTYNLLKAVIESPNLKTKIESIRSGGQTGFDEAGTKAGIKLGLPTLTLAPKGWTFRDITGKDISNEQQFKARFGEVITQQPQLVENIYNQLGNKTVSNNVEILDWKDLKEYDAPIEKDLEGNLEFIISTRIPKVFNHFGNPFSHDPAGKTQGLIKTETIKEAVEKYIDWVINSKDDRAEWIRKQIQSGKLKGLPILYYKELNQPSHATALDYLINKHNWNIETNNQPSQLSLFPELSEQEFNNLTEEERATILWQKNNC
jgi:hypothetical protein